MLLDPSRDKTLDHGATGWNVLRPPQSSERIFMVLAIPFECLIKFDSEANWAWQFHSCKVLNSEFNFFHRNRTIYIFYFFLSFYKFMSFKNFVHFI